jgi:hypothetical protein
MTELIKGVSEDCDTEWGGGGGAANNKAEGRGWAVAGEEAEGGWKGAMSGRSP